MSLTILLCPNLSATSGRTPTFLRWSQARPLANRMALVPKQIMRGAAKIRSSTLTKLWRLSKALPFKVAKNFVVDTAFWCHFSLIFCGLYSNDGARHSTQLGANYVTHYFVLSELARNELVHANIFSLDKVDFLVPFFVDFLRPSSKRRRPSFNTTREQFYIFSDNLLKFSM